MRTRCLSIHAGYRCRHSGACCSDVWVIPAEAHVVETVARRGIRPPAGDTPVFVEPPNGELAGTPLVLAQAGGSCVFLDTAGGRLCAIHRDAGPEALPSSCRHFPRVFLRDRRGLSLSLSHFCPTAASMLFDDVPIAIVDAPPPLALDEPVEGLDAVDALPPLLAPDVLMDLDAYDAWERAALETFARGDLTHEGALDRVSAATDAVRGWRPGGMPLRDAVREAFVRTPAPMAPPEEPDDAARLMLVDDASPAPVRPVVPPVPEEPSVWRELVSPVWHACDPVVRRYLAARLFANWMAYRGRGLRSVVELLRVCLAVLRREVARRASAAGRTPGKAEITDALRETDRVMLHVVDSQSLAALLRGVEYR